MKKKKKKEIFSTSKEDFKKIGIPDNESGNDGDDNSAKNSHEEFERKFGKIK